MHFMPPDVLIIPPLYNYDSHVVGSQVHVHKRRVKVSFVVKAWESKFKFLLRKLSFALFSR